MEIYRKLTFLVRQGKNLLTNLRKKDKRGGKARRCRVLESTGGDQEWGTNSVICHQENKTKGEPLGCGHC